MVGGAVFCLGQRGGARGAGRAGLYAGGAEARRTLGRGGGGRRVLRLSSEDEAEFDCNSWDTGEWEEPRMISLSSPKSIMEKWRNIRDCWLRSEDMSLGAPELTLVSLYEEVKLFSNSKSCWDSLASRSPAEVARPSKVMDVGIIPLEPRNVCWERCRVSALPIIISASLTLAWRVSFFCLWPSARLNNALPRLTLLLPSFRGLWWYLLFAD